MSEKLRNSNERGVEKQQGNSSGSKTPKSDKVREETKKDLYNNLKK